MFLLWSAILFWYRFDFTFRFRIHCFSYFVSRNGRRPSKFPANRLNRFDWNHWDMSCPMIHGRHGQPTTVLCLTDSGTLLRCIALGNRLMVSLMIRAPDHHRPPRYQSLHRPSAPGVRLVRPQYSVLNARVCAYISLQYHHRIYPTFTVVCVHYK